MIEKCDREYPEFITLEEKVVDGRVEKRQGLCCKYHKEVVDLSLLDVPRPTKKMS